MTHANPDYRRYALVRIKEKPHIYREDGEWLTLDRFHGDWWLQPLWLTWPDMADRLGSDAPHS